MSNTTTFATVRMAQRIAKGGWKKRTRTARTLHGPRRYVMYYKLISDHAQYVSPSLQSAYSVEIGTEQPVVCPIPLGVNPKRRARAGVFNLKHLCSNQLPWKR